MTADSVTVKVIYLGSGKAKCPKTNSVCTKICNIWHKGRVWRISDMESGKKILIFIFIFRRSLQSKKGRSYVKTTSVRPSVRPSVTYYE